MFGKNFLKEIAKGAAHVGGEIAKGTDHVSGEVVKGTVGAAGAVGGAMVVAGDNIGGAAGAVGNVVGGAAVATAGAVGSAVGSFTRTVGGAVVDGISTATSSAGEAIDFAQNSPALRKAVQTFNVDWLLKILETTDVERAQTVVEGLKQKYPDLSAYQIAKKSSEKKQLLLLGWDSQHLLYLVLRFRCLVLI